MSSTLHRLGMAGHLLADCPSELTIDRLQLEELDQAHEAHAHVADCEICQRRLAQRSPFDRGQRLAMLTAISNGRRPGWGERLRAYLQPLTRFALVGTTIALVLMLLPPHPEVTRTKGALRLKVYREHQGQVTEALSGETFAPGDRLRFEVGLPSPGHLMIVGVEQSGALFPYYPSGPHSRTDQVTDPHLLPGAVELDASSGQEQLHAILCPRPFALGDVTVDEGRVVRPAGCVTAPFAMSKADP